MSDHKPGDRVRIRSGPFASFAGEVEEVLPGPALKVVIVMFGRRTQVELPPREVERVEPDEWNRPGPFRPENN